MENKAHKQARALPPGFKNIINQQPANGYYFNTDTSKQLSQQRLKTDVAMPNMSLDEGEYFIAAERRKAKKIIDNLSHQSIKFDQITPRKFVKKNLEPEMNSPLSRSYQILNHSQYSQDLKNQSTIDLHYQIKNQIEKTFGSTTSYNSRQNINPLHVTVIDNHKANKAAELLFQSQQAWKKEKQSLLYKRRNPSPTNQINGNQTPGTLQYRNTSLSNLIERPVNFIQKDASPNNWLARTTTPNLPLPIGPFASNNVPDSTKGQQFYTPILKMSKMQEQEELVEQQPIPGLGNWWTHVQSVFAKPVEPIVQKVNRRSCNCGTDESLPQMCVRAKQWYMATSKRDILQDYQKLKQTFKTLAELPVDKDSEAQIDRDLSRTFPKHPFFMSQDGVSKGVMSLKRVLTAFANYERQVDYVQGMNFIVGQLLLHSSETMAFWLFVSLIEDCDMRDIYLPRLPGLYKHSSIIEILIERHLPNLSRHLQLHNIKAEMYTSEWIFGLFASVIPLDQMGEFFNLYFQFKWIFFYQLVLCILSSNQAELLRQDDLYSILGELKQRTASLGPNNDKKHSQQSNDQTDFGVISFFRSLTFVEKPTLLWIELIKKSQQEWQVLHKDSQAILRLLNNFDTDSLNFTSAIPIQKDLLFQ